MDKDVKNMFDKLLEDIDMSNRDMAKEAIRELTPQFNHFFTVAILQEICKNLDIDMEAVKKDGDWIIKCVVDGEY